MRQLDPDEIERILSTPTVAELTLNDLRILVGALNALEYFGAAHGECYLDSEGRDLRSRLEKKYTALAQDKIFRARIRPVAVHPGPVCPK